MFVHIINSELLCFSYNEIIFIFVAACSVSLCDCQGKEEDGVDSKVSEASIVLVIKQ